MRTSSWLAIALGITLAIIPLLYAVITTEAWTPLKNTVHERTTVTGGGTATLLDVSGPGVVRSLNVIIGTDSGAPDFSALYSQLHFYVDGEVTPSSSPLLVDFFFSRGFPSDAGSGTKWQSDRIGLSRFYKDLGIPDTRIGYYRYVDLPYKSGMKITLENGDGTADFTLFSEVDYHDGGESSMFYGKPLVIDIYDPTNVAKGQVATPYEVVDLLNEGSGKGWVESIYLCVFDANAQPWAEGNVDIYIDGEVSPSFTSSGTEDFFMDSWAWASGTYLTRNHGNIERSTTTFTSAYRFFNDEPVRFNDGVRITWQAGELSQGGMTQDIEIWATIVYYLED
jgi:hypothetical protein